MLGEVGIAIAGWPVGLARAAIRSRSSLARSFVSSCVCLKASNAFRSAKTINSPSFFERELIISY
jgi:hypothetical protein